MTSQTTYEVEYDTDGNVVKKTEPNTDKHLYDDTNKANSTLWFGW